MSASRSSSSRESEPLLEQFVGVAQGHLQRGDREWREQIMLRAEGGRRVLMCACTELPGDTDSPNGYAIVFDDITALLQAQRDAAWGEVARRLAHEIKNPLTPIQLSAERLRRKYLKPDSGDGELLDRATHTIIQQVEAMKQMVNAFSEYARTPRMEITRVDVNGLIAELCDLYAHQEKPLAITLSLSRDLPPIEADAGRLRQVLHNLLRNSLEAMEHQDEARVEISTRSQRHGLGTGRDQGGGQRPRLLARHRAPSIRAVRDEQAQRNGARSRDRQEARRGARRPDQRAQP